jgi:hypothetical protein
MSAGIAPSRLPTLRLESLDQVVVHTLRRVADDPEAVRELLEAHRRHQREYLAVIDRYAARQRRERGAA